MQANDEMFKKETNDILVSKIKLYANFIDIGGNSHNWMEARTITNFYVKESIEMEETILIGGAIFETAISNEPNNLNEDVKKLNTFIDLKVRSNSNVLESIQTNSRFNVLFTLNEPLNADKVNKGEQDVYITSQTQPNEFNNYLENSKDPRIQKILAMDKAINETTYQLDNLQTIIKTQTAMYFVNGFKPKYDGSPIEITFNNDTLPQNIYALKENNQPTKTMLLNQDKYALVKATPISKSSERLLFKFEDFDIDKTLPYAYLKKMQNKDIFDLRPEIMTSDTQWKKDLWQLFLSIFELTKAFANAFSEYQLEVEDKDGKRNISGIDPNATIGGFKIKLLENTSDSMEAISGRIESWKMRYPTMIYENEFKKFKNFLSMLTPYIKCDLALGGGMNHMNKVNSLFYFDLKTGIQKGMANKENLSKPFNVQLKSNFYDTSSGTFKMKEQFNNIGDIQVVHANGEMTLQPLPKDLSELDVSNKNGHKNPSSPTLTSYYVYAPVKDEAQRIKMFGGVKEKVIPVQTRTFNTTYKVMLLENSQTNPKLDGFEKISVPGSQGANRHGYAPRVYYKPTLSNNSYQKTETKDDKWILKRLKQHEKDPKWTYFRELNALGMATLAFVNQQELLKPNERFDLNAPMTNVISKYKRTIWTYPTYHGFKGKVWDEFEIQFTGKVITDAITNVFQKVKSTLDFDDIEKMNKVNTSNDTHTMAIISNNTSINSLVINSIGNGVKKIKINSKSDNPIELDLEHITTTRDTQKTYLKINF